MKKVYSETALGEIEYEYREGNPLVLFLKGFGSFDTAQSFSKISELLPDSYGIVAPNYLNCGFSGHSVQPYTIKDEAVEIAKIVNKLNASGVIIVAHSFGVVYAMYLKDMINNVKAFVGIEPTTREIMTNPPREEAYLELEENADEVQQQVMTKLFELFTKEEAENFLATTERNASRFDDDARQALAAAEENDTYLQRDTKMQNMPTTIFTEAFRKNEYLRSEYLSDHPASKVISIGTFHYLQWENPTEIAEAISGVF